MGGESETFTSWTEFQLEHSLPLTYLWNAVAPTNRLQLERTIPLGCGGDSYF